MKNLISLLVIMTTSVMAFAQTDYNTSFKKKLDATKADGYALPALVIIEKSIPDSFQYEMKDFTVTSIQSYVLLKTSPFDKAVGTIKRSDGKIGSVLIAIDKKCNETGKSCLGCKLVYEKNSKEFPSEIALLKLVPPEPLTQ